MTQINSCQDSRPFPENFQGIPWLQLMKKFLVPKDSKDAKKDRTVGACKRGDGISSHEVLQIPSKRSHEATAVPSRQEIKKVRPSSAEKIPFNKFHTPKRSDEKRHDSNLTKIQKLSYLMKTEYFTVQSSTPDEAQIINEGERQREELKEEKEDERNESINNNREEDDAVDRVIVLSDGNSDPGADLGEEQDEEDENRSQGPVIQKSMEEYYDVDPIKMEEKLRSHSLSHHISQPQASPYFSRTPFQFYQNPAQYSKPFQLYRSNVSSVLIKKFTNPSIATIRSHAYTSHRNGGVTCLEFDPLGVLVAVGSSNGVLRVYDSDEILFQIQNHKNSPTR
jgi:WD40 repeat protein